MKTIDKYTDLALKNGFKNYSAIARKLDITPAGLSAIRSDKSPASEKTLILLAEAAGVNPLEVVAAYKIERGRNWKVIRFWRTVQEGMAASFLAVAMLGSMAFSIINKLDALYIMLTRLNLCTNKSTA